MTNFAHRADQLLSPDRSRDFLIHIGWKQPRTILADLHEISSTQVPDGTRFRLYAGKHAPLKSARSPDGLLQAWVLGGAFHPHVADGSIARWVLERIESERHAEFASVEGLFSAFAFDARVGVFHVITDVLGLRPLFLRREGSHTWIANRVGTAWDSSAIPAPINGEALRSWAYFGYNATDGALLRGWRRLPGAVHLAIRPNGISESAYHTFDFSPRETVATEAYDRMFESVRSSVRLQTRGQGEVKLALSGGFDSRLLAAFASREIREPLRPMVVDGSDNYRDRINGQSTERWIAQKVCSQLSIPLEVIDLAGTEPMQAYGEPFLLRHDGFPITKQIIQFVVGDRDRTPVVNGFLGGNLLKGVWDRIGGKTELELGDNDVLTKLLARHSQLPLHLLEPSIARSLNDWARAFMTQVIAPFRSEHRAVAASSIWMHDRLYMSNNFLQHLHLSEPVLPYATAELVAQKLAVRDGTMSFEGFRAALARHFPTIADIPHTHDIERPVPRFRLSERSNREWARQCLFAIRKQGALRPFDRIGLAPRLVLASVEARYAYVAQTAMRFLVLEALAERLGLTIDWKA